MNEIRCPNCGTVFQIDENDYASIVKQVHDKEFNEELARREKALLEQKNSEYKLLQSENENKHKQDLFVKEQEIIELKNQIKQLNISSDQTLALSKNEIEKKYRDELADYEKKILKLENDLELKDSSYKAELNEKLAEKANELAKLNDKLVNTEAFYGNQLKAKQEEVDFYKDFKAKQSTKLIGESLEVHCATEFNKLRPLFPHAYFDKDNEISKDSGSKGDFIYRDYDDDHNEIISIMFEMKNEADTTATKHKNEHFLKELDKDRKEKKCEYAILVSLLEPDNELYNTGIVDVSYQYPKMYVIRPQFFIPIITLLRNAALNAADYKRQLAIIQNQNIDIANFEDNMNKFKDGFGRNYELASRKFKDAIDDIDKAIKALEKTKNELMSSENNLRLANNKLQDLSIKRLTHNSPTVAKMFDDMKNE